MATLDLRAPSITIKFDKGKDISPIFYYLSPTSAIIDLTNYHCRMQAKVDYLSTPTLDLDDQLKGGLSIVTGTAVLDNGTSIPGAYGVKLSLTAAQTALLVTDLPLLFDIELVDPVNNTLPFLKGILLPSAEVTT